MSVLVFIESADGTIKKSSLEAVSYGKKLAELEGTEATAVYLGKIDTSELERVGRSGAQKVLYADHDQLKNGVIQAYASVLVALVYISCLLCLATILIAPSFSSSSAPIPR